MTTYGEAVDNFIGEILSKEASPRVSRLRSRRESDSTPIPRDEGEVSTFQWLRGRRTKSDIEAQHQDFEALQNGKPPNRAEIRNVNWAVPSLTETPPTPPHEPNQVHDTSKFTPDISTAPGVPSIVVEDTTDDSGANVTDPGISRDVPSNVANELSLPFPPPQKLKTARPERLEENVPAKRKNFEVPNVTSRRFRWIHIACNNMLFVQKAFQTIAEEKKKPRLFEELLRPQAWAFKQHVGRHDSPHACFMEPHFEAVRPTTSLMPETARAENLQMYIYVRSIDVVLKTASLC